MRKLTLLILALLMVTGAVVTAPPAVEAVSGGGTPGCAWTCDCAGRPVCTCAAGISGFCVSPPNIGCAQSFNC